MHFRNLPNYFLLAEATSNRLRFPFAAYEVSPPSGTADPGINENNIIPDSFSELITNEILDMYGFLGLRKCLNLIQLLK